MAFRFPGNDKGQNFNYFCLFMCTSPLTIHNKGLRYNPGLLNLQVPCGNCNECHEVKSIDYFVRAYSIFRALPNNWSCYFMTFTHSLENVPRSDFYKYDPEKSDYIKVYENVPVFNHDLIHRAMKSWRQKYRRDYEAKYHKKPNWNDLPMYLISSEFGESDNGHHLPHYHGIFFVPKLISWQAFKKEIETYWTYGFTKDVRIHKYAIFKDRTPENCFKYVVKYAAKGVGYCPPYLMDKKSLIPSLADYYQIEPRIFTSNNFGAQLENTLNESNYLTGAVTLSVAGKYYQYKVPSYYLRRHFTKTIVDNSWKIECPEVVYPFRILKSKTLYRKCTHTKYINNYIETKLKNLRSNVAKQFFHASEAYKRMSPDFQDFLCRHTLSPSSLIDSLSVYDKDTFVDDFIRFQWSDKPMATYDYEMVSVDSSVLLQKIPIKWVLYYRGCQLYEAGLSDWSKEFYDWLGPGYKNLPDKIKYVSLHQNNPNCKYAYGFHAAAHPIDSDFMDRFYMAFTALSVYADYERFNRLRLQEKERRDEKEFYERSVKIC